MHWIEMKAVAVISVKRAKKKKGRLSVMMTNSLMYLPGNTKATATGNYIRKSLSLKWPNLPNAVINSRMKYCLGLLMILLTGMVCGQSVLSKIPATGNTWSSFIPEGYDTLAIG